jgi:CRISPR-associated protein Csb2
MTRVLLISVRFHDGRYHGAGNWPPAPSRLFQALVAGIGQDGPLTDELSRPLEWLEKLDAPIIAAPHSSRGQAVNYFVPNNDLDAVRGDPSKIGAIRTARWFKPRLFDQARELLYAWKYLEIDADQHVEKVRGFADRLYQLGRGIDIAWAWADTLTPAELDDRLAAYRGAVHRPGEGSGGNVLLCPQEGSLQSLKVRHAAMSKRFQPQGQGKSVKWRFTQPPKPLFRPVAYDCPPISQLYELQGPDGSRHAVPLHRIAGFVQAARDGAAERLRSSHAALVDRYLIGRPSDAGHVPHDQRIRLIPIPSIGFIHADHGIRRLLVEVHSGCPLPAEDVFWAFSGLTVEGGILATASDKSMLHHFGVGRDHVIWRTVSPIALPSGRRRIDPHRPNEEAKHGNERGEEQRRAAAALVQAIRHAGIAARAESIRLQREPFHAKGERVESFAPGTRFPKERLWHAEIAFAEPVSGPLILGDGRYCGLGLLAPLMDA